MNVSRRCTSGEVVESESLNQSQLYITTAGYKNTYSYNKLIQLLVRMVIEPEKAFIMGGSYRIPVLLGLQNKNFIEDLKKDATFNEASFGRESNDFQLTLNLVNCWKALERVISNQAYNWKAQRLSVRSKLLY